MTEVYATPQTQTAARPGGAAPSLGARPILSVRQIEKVYGNRDSVTRAINDISFDVAPGEFVGIMGPSGSGKTTLLNCVATIDTVTSGHILVDGRDITGLRSRALAKFRRDDLGFIFQDSNLLDTLTGFENIALALTIQKTPVREIDPRVREAARTLGIEDELQKYPYQMSGGQKQRVAAARATVTRPHLVLADEPTGALDSKSARQLLESLAHLNERGSTILMVTHDSFSASYCNRIVFIKDGGLYGELRRNGTERSAFYRRIVDVVSSMGGAGEDDAADEVTRHAC